MSKIQYPMTTAAIFDDVVYPLHFDNAGKVRQEMEGAVNWSAGGATKRKPL